MTLESAIQHCEEVAEENECTAHSLTKDGWQEHFNNLSQEKEAEYKNAREEMANSCLECAEEHRQLAEWLRELKQRRKYENGCQYCKYKFRSDEDEPCVICSHNYTDKFKDDGTREVNADEDRGE